MQISKPIVVAFALLMTRSMAFAQGVDTGSLRGRISDATNAALPGVTVTAASPAVMGGSLTAVTSAEGLYRFPVLPPGVYEVRMELQGFKSVSVPNIHINVGLALTIDQVMPIGSVEESLTVVGESPIVDTKNTSQQANWTQELMQNLPSARDLWSTMQQVPGLVMGKENIGGLESPFLSTFQVHGSVNGAHQYNFNGIDVSDMHSGIGLGYYNTDSFEEIQFTTSGISAEYSRGGLIINTVTKSGGNRFSGQFASYYEGHSLQANNVDDALRARGVKGAGAPLNYLRDLSATLGGPIMKDRIWFFGAARENDVYPLVVNCTLPNGSQCQDGERLPNLTAKINMQFNPANQLMVMYDRGFLYRPDRGIGQFTTLAASASESFHYDIWEGKYNRILGHALLEVGIARGSPPWHLGYNAAVTNNSSTAFDVITQVRSDAMSGAIYQQGDILVYNGNMSYFKDRLFGAAHDLKFGGEHRRGKLQQGYQRNQNLERDYQGGAPYRVQVFNTPVNQLARNYSLAGFVQDSIRVGKHLTFNLGERTEWWRGDVPAQTNQPAQFAGIFGPATNFPAQTGVMEWTTFSPRFGAVYDVSGDSKTVVKATYGRYYFQIRSTDLNSYANANGVATATFDWLDSNGNNFPDYPTEFGTLRSLNLPAKRSIVPGLQAPYSDEITGSMERQLGQRISVSARYTYRKNNRLLAQTDLALPDSAFSIPSTAVDPLTGTAINYWSLGPTYKTVQNNIVLSQFDTNWTRYNGLDLVFNRRFDNRWLFIASLTIQDNYGRIAGFMDRNDRTIFPYGAVGLDAPYMGKIEGTYVLPWDIRASGFFRHVSGMNSNNDMNPAMARTVQVKDATTGSLYQVRVQENGTYRQDSTNIFDIRLSKVLKFKSMKVEALVDGFNMMNANNILATGVITGSNLGVPVRIVTPRVFRLGMKFNF